MKIGPKNHPDPMSDPLFWFLILLAIFLFVVSVAQDVGTMS